MTTVMWGGLGVSWVIVGAESGHGARACDIEWVREIVEFCQDHNVPVFVKQLINNGRKIPFNQWPEDLRVRQMPKIRGAA
jgi:protein gp37